jgi:hypothetical protein
VYNSLISTKGYKMPNWVFNGLTIEGNPEQVTKLQEQMNTPFVDSIKPNGDLAFGISQRKYVNPIFSFRNIISPTDLEAYKAQPVRSELEVSDENWWADTQKLSLTDNSWYNWNIRNWGVKWDVAVPEDEKYPNTYMEEYDNGENKVVYYNFDTAWGIPDKALINLSSQYPSLLFTLSYEEETGWGGEMEFLRGVIISQSEYENKCKDCDAEDTLEYCENECGEICSKCNWLGEADLDTVAICQTHAIYLADKVPTYRKVEE